MDHQEPGGKPRIGLRAIALAVVLVGAPALVVFRPWEGIDTTTALVVGGFGLLFALLPLLVLRRELRQRDRHEARVVVTWSPGGEPDDPATVTVECTDLISRGRFYQLAQSLRRTLPGIGGARVSQIRLDPPRRENAMHIDTTRTGMHVVYLFVQGALLEHGITRVETAYSPPLPEGGEP
ncbi:hypothetical protein [Actinokineospora sp. NPDC004072]